MSDEHIPSASLIAIELQKAGVTVAPGEAIKIATGLKKGAFAIEDRMRTELADVIQEMAHQRTDGIMRDTILVVIKAIRAYPLDGDPS